MDVASNGSVLLIGGSGVVDRRAARALRKLQPEMSRWVADMLRRPVVKAYNNIWADDLLRRGRPRGAGDRIALPIAGDDPKAKAKVMALTNALGFDAVDAGGIDDSWRQQPGTPVYTANLDVAGTLRVLAEARSERLPDLSGTPASPGSWTDPR